MKLQANLDDEKLDVEINREGDHVSAKIGDREYDLEVTEFDANTFAFRDGATLTEVFVSPSKTGPTKTSIAGRDFEIEIVDPKRLRGSGADAEHAGGAAEIRTAMPGKVVRLLVKKGAEVKKGDGVIVVEAMKMQNEMKSPKDGVVIDIKADEGQTVNAGDVLAVIE